jgi:hypothetical protein
MMDDSCSPRRMDFPWLQVSQASFVDDDEWIFAHNHTQFPWLWLSQVFFMDDGWILLTNKPQLESQWINNRHHTTLDGLCVHKKTLFYYILVST